jgi:RNA:NAD 2'-phosphotransferase (TPT1/KptA family)
VSHLPVGHDVAQLIEDAALLPVTDDGFRRRRDLLRRYLAELELEIDAEVAVSSYDWFSLYRAVWVASAASASKARHTHARELAQYLASKSASEDVRRLAEQLVPALRQLHLAEQRGAVDRVHRQSSKQLAKILRHDAPELGLSVDPAGFVPLDGVASVVGLPVDDVVRIATHPAEPRFEVVDDSIRALYGHSFQVVDLPDLDIELPGRLYHCTSWEALPAIAGDEGLRPMARQKVHLTNNPSEAMEVARRHELPALLSVDTSKSGPLQAVADAVWAANAVPAEALEVLNPFALATPPPDWLSNAVAQRVAGGA